MLPDKETTSLAAELLKQGAHAILLMTHPSDLAKKGTDSRLLVVAEPELVKKFWDLRARGYDLTDATCSLLEVNKEHYPWLGQSTDMLLVRHDWVYLLDANIKRWGSSTIKGEPMDPVYGSQDWRIAAVHHQIYLPRAGRFA